MFELVVSPVIADMLLLLVRAILVIAFAVSAKNKFANMKQFAKQNDVPLPVSYVVATAELLAALGMATGVLAQWAGLGLLLLMLGTMSLHIFKWHSPYWASKGGWEYDLLLCTLAGVVVVFGTGTFVLL